MIDIHLKELELMKQVPGISCNIWPFIFLLNFQTMQFRSGVNSQILHEPEMATD